MTDPNNPATQPISPCPMTGHKFVRVFPGLIPESSCAAMTEAFLNDGRTYKGKVGGGNAENYDPRVKRCRELRIHSAMSGWSKWDQVLMDAMAEGLITYGARVPFFGEILRKNAVRDRGYQLQFYAAGEKDFDGGGDGFGWHADVFDSNSAGRLLAAIIYLNTIEVGGETEFAAQAITIQPRAGSLLLFPPSFEYVHRGATPRSGPKLIATTFVEFPHGHTH